jgi:sulfopyruvate decarboxylase subunit alpha
MDKGTLRGDELARALVAHGFDFFTGVPCSLVASLIVALEPHGYVAGRRPLVLMQNSGFGVSLNAIGSLQDIYALPCLLVVTWRGYQGNDAPEHLVMGEAMPAILDAMRIPWREISAAGAADDVAWARARLDAKPGPVALVVKPGVLA